MTKLRLSLPPHEIAAVVITGVLVACTFVPPSLYQKYLHEHDYALGNLGLIIFMVACLTAYLMGSRVASAFDVRRKQAAVRVGVKLDRRLFNVAFAVWVLLTVIWLMIYLSNFSLVNVFLSLTGAAAADVVGMRHAVADILAESHAGWIIPGLLCTLVTMLAVVVNPVGPGNCNVKWRTRQRRLVVLATVLFVLVVVLTFTRAAVFYLFIEFVVIKRLVTKAPLSNDLLRYLLIGSAIIAGTIALQSLRYSDTGLSGHLSATTMRFFMGYLPGSVNRAAAVIDGRMHLPGSELAFYSLGWLWNFPGLSRLFDLYGWAHSISKSFPVDDASATYQIFRDVSYAGLNKLYNWPTFFGVAYSELGLLSPIFFGFFGFVTGMVYRAAFRRGNLFAFIIYPYLTLMVVLWLMGTTTFSRFVDIYFVVAVIVVILHRLCFRKRSVDGGINGRTMVDNLKHSHSHA